MKKIDGRVRHVNTKLSAFFRSGTTVSHQGVVSFVATVITRKDEFELIFFIESDCGQVVVLKVGWTEDENETTHVCE